MIENLPGEEWRDIAGFEGKYRVSNRGRVLSLVRKQPAILAGNPNSMGYPQVDLRSGGPRKPFLVHRLVLMAFAPVEDSSDLQANHIDFDPMNSSLENLEWTTPLQNMRHFFSSERTRDMSKNVGSRHHLSNLKDADVLEIRRLCVSRVRGNRLAVARQFGIHKATVDQIVSWKTWRHLLPTI